MNSFKVSEHNRLSSEVAVLEERLARTKRGHGLKSRSVHSFLYQLRRHKREILKSLDSKLASKDDDRSVN